MNPVPIPTPTHEHIQPFSYCRCELLRLGVALEPLVSGALAPVWYWLCADCDVYFAVRSDTVSRGKFSTSHRPRRRTGS